MTGEKPEEWMKWLSLAKYFHNSINTILFEVLYGQPVPFHVPCVPKDSSVESMDMIMHAREQTIAMLNFNLKATQDRMKVYAERKMNDKEFEVGDWVYVKLQPYRQLTIRVNKQHKLFAKFYGPFQALEKIGTLAYKLELPPTALVHLVFHVSQLKNVILQV